MSKFIKKPIVIEAITFEELVKHGLENDANVVNEIPWSWNYNGHAITHENDQCYLIPTLEGTMKMTPNDMLITGVKGEIYPCKKDIFEATYDSVVSENAELTFGQAIEALKEGKKVARSGWNGKGMFVYLQKGFELKEPARNEILAQYQLENSNQPVTLCSHIDMKAADGSIVIGWLASQTDMLAEDWCILD